MTYHYSWKPVIPMLLATNYFLEHELKQSSKSAIHDGSINQA